MISFKTNILKRYLNGETVQQIAESEGCYYSTVLRALKRKGLILKRGKRRRKIKAQTIIIIGEKQYKICSNCKKILPLNRFRKDKGQSTGFHSQCKNCKAKIDKADYQKRRKWLITDFIDFLNMKPSKIYTFGKYKYCRFKGLRGDIPEHRWIMMKKLGRPLRGWEWVHHKNKNTLDNRLENLELSPPMPEHNFESHLKASINSLKKENEKLRKKIKELEKN